MATKFQIKRSSVSGRTPNTTNAANSSYIAAGELALNLTDKKMYSSNGTNYFEIGSFKVELVNSTSNVSTFTQISTLQFDEDSGFDVTNPSAGIAKVAMNSTFKFWQVDGVQKLTATGLDTVNFIGGNNISITANGANTPQSIAFATSMTPTFTSVTFGNSTVNTTINSSAIAVSKIFANGVVGTAGKVLTSNGTGGIYWGDASSGGAGGDLTIISDTFNGNGSNTVYTLSVSTSTDKTFVYLNGVLQAPTTDYSVTGTTLTFVTAPPSDNVIEVRSFDIPSVADLTVTSDNFTGNGSNTQFTLTTSQSSNETSLVFLNGVAQVPTTDYSISGSTLTFTAAPANATNIQVTSYTAEDIVTTTYTGNGSNTQFTLGTTSTTTKTVVSLNGVTQTPTADYSVSGATLVFSVAPANNDKIIARAIPSTTSSTAGSNTNIQYNKSGSPGGSAGFTFNETTNNVTIANTLTVPNFILNASNPPANSTSTGTTGTFAWDSTFFYIATGTNTWKKVPITTDGSGGGGGSANTAGSNTQVQFNDSGVLGATAGFTFNKDSNNLTVANTLTLGKLSANGSTGAGKILAANSTGGIFWSDGGGYGVTRNEFTANGTAVNFTLSRQPFSEEHVLVFVDGVIQRDADISVSGTTLTFAVAPDNLSEIEAFVFQTGAATPGGSNTHIQYNDSGVMEGSAAFTFNEATNTVNLSNTLTIGSNVTVNTSTIFIGNSSVNTTITAGNVHLQGTQLTVGNTVLTGQQITVGNSTVNSVIRANGATFTGDLMPSANVTYDIGNSAMRWRDLWLSGTTINLGGATIKTDTDTGAIAFVPKATAGVPNPKAVVVSPRGGIQAVDTTDGVPIINNSITTVDGVLYGNSTVNTTINSSSVSTIVLNVGSNVFVNTSTIHLGNSTVNTVIHTTGFTGNGAGLHSVNAAALEGNTVANILTAANTAANTLANAAYTNAIAYSGNAAQAYSNATSYADTVAATAFTNAASRADSAYSNAIAYSGNAVQAYNNAVAYAASNTYVNSTFLPLAGGTLTGAITVGNSTVNSVVNSTAASLGNTTINGFVNVSSNLTVTSVAAFGNNVTITGNLIVTGTRIFANTTTVDLSDSIITLNADIGEGVPSENAGLEVHRGSSANVQFVWNETIDKWTFTTDGTNYVTVASNNDVTTAYSNAIAYSGNAALAYANAIAYAASNSYVNSTFAPLSGATFTGAVSGITTLAAGNTTITGLINVSTNTATFGTAVNIVANGNVGIGTSSPSSKLDLVGVLQWQATAGTVLGKLTYSGGEPVVLANTGLGLNFYTNNAFAAKIDSSGNFGIGTSSPGTKLDVLSGTNGGIRVSDGTYTGIMYPSGLGGIAVGTTSNHPYLILTNNSERMRIDSSGNVGIGTTTPASKLRVEGGTISQYKAAGDNNGVLISGADANNNYIRLQNSFATVDYGQGATAAFVNVNNNQPWYVSVSDAARLWIANTGNIGIGTSSPAAKLDVQGGRTYLAASSEAFAAYLRYNTSTAGVFIGSPSADAFQISKSSGAALFNIASSGDIGMGSAVGDNTLRYFDVYNTNTGSSAGSIIRLITSNTAGTGLTTLDIVKYKTGGVIINNNETDSGAYISLNVGGGERLRVAANGNVGVANSTPTAKFQVTHNGSNGGGGLADYGILVTATSAQATIGAIGDGDVYGNLNLGSIISGTTRLWHISKRLSGSSHDLHYYYYNGSAFTLHTAFASNGNIGIGNTAPTSKLQVEGNVYVSGTLTEASSITLKENIDPITGALSLILGINGYTYDRKDGSRKQEPGLIAEEVEQVLPNIVQKDDEGNPTGIQYTKIIAYLVESIKELKAEIDILKGK